jgi:hypothetical protein
MDHKPVIPIEAPLPAEPAYQGPLVLPKPGAFAAPRAAAAAAIVGTAALAPETAGEGQEAKLQRNLFAGARPLNEWPQAWML